MTKPGLYHDSVSDTIVSDTVLKGYEDCALVRVLMICLYDLRRCKDAKPELTKQTNIIIYIHVIYTYICINIYMCV